ncbi:MAG: FecCD family ABC transporter permease [Thermoplasmata archaeon]
MIGPTPGSAGTAPDPRLPRWVLAFLGFAGTLAALVFLSPAFGSVRIPWHVVFAIILRQVTDGAYPSSACGSPSFLSLYFFESAVTREGTARLLSGLSTSYGARQCEIWTTIAWDARMPPLLLAVFAGAALGISGGALQGTFRNPLVDPYLLGLSTGAAVGASILFTFNLAPAQQATALPLLAFCGGLVPGLVVYLAARGGGRSVETLLLTGVALNFLFSAILDLLLLYRPSSNINVNFWLLGGLGDASWTHDAIVLSALLLGGTAIGLYGRELNILQLGSDVAESVGVDARRVTRRVVLVTSLLTATAVAFTGVIGFVGLVSPHIARRFVGPDYRRVLPVVALVGALFLTLSWDIAETVISPIVLPVGIPTAFVGAPFFLYLLYRRRTGTSGSPA